MKNDTLRTLIRSIIKEEIKKKDEKKDNGEKNIFKKTAIVKNTDFTEEERRLFKKYLEKHAKGLSNIKFKNNMIMFKKTIPKLFSEDDEKMNKVADFSVFKQFDLKENKKLNYIMKVSFNEVGGKNALIYRKSVKIGLFDKEDTEKLQDVFKKINKWKWN